MILLLLACTCPTGTSDNGRGECTDDAATDTASDTSGFTGDGTLGWADVQALLPPCEPLQADDALDFEGVCIDGGCAGDGLSVFQDLWGDATSCDAGECEWSRGVIVEFDDDPLSGGRATEFQVTESGVGRDTNGLGIGASMSCFAEIYGMPDLLSIGQDSDGIYLYWLSYADPNLSVFNHGSDDWGADDLIFE